MEYLNCPMLCMSFPLRLKSVEYSFMNFDMSLRTITIIHELIVMKLPPIIDEKLYERSLSTIQVVVWAVSNLELNAKSKLVRDILNLIHWPKTCFFCFCISIIKSLFGVHTAKARTEAKHTGIWSKKSRKKID